MSCYPVEEKLPQGILSETQMVNVITDLQLLDAAQKSFSVGSTDARRMRDTSYMIVFNKYEITSMDFDSSLRSYARRPLILSRIMDKVGKKINTHK